MRDLSTTRRIKTIYIDGSYLEVGNSMFPSCYEKITAEEKTGDMAHVIWYQCWFKGEVVKEVNSRFVIAVDYEPTPSDEPIPF